MDSGLAWLGCLMAVSFGVDSHDLTTEATGTRAGRAGGPPCPRPEPQREDKGARWRGGREAQKCHAVLVLACEWSRGQASTLVLNRREHSDTDQARLQNLRAAVRPTEREPSTDQPCAPPQARAADLKGGAGAAPSRTPPDASRGCALGSNQTSITAWSQTVISEAPTTNLHPVPAPPEHTPQALCEVSEIQGFGVFWGEGRGVLKAKG